jgi:threonine dehydratase
VAFRAIPLRGDLLRHPLFLRLDFYERPGALHDFLSRLIRDRASLCYFNYRQSGERVGRALIGLDFDSAETREAFLASLPEQGEGYRSCRPLDEAATRRLIG